MSYNVCKLYVFVFSLVLSDAPDLDEDLDEDRMVSSAVEALEKLFSETLSKGLQSALGNDQAQGGENGNLSILYL